MAPIQPPSPDGTTEPITTKEVAERYFRSIKTIHRMVKDGRLTPLKQLDGMRGAYLFDQQQVADVFAKKDAA